MTSTLIPFILVQISSGARGQTAPAVPQGLAVQK